MSCSKKTLDGIARIDATDVDFNGNVEVDNITVNNDATVGNNVSVGNDLTVAGDGSITGTLQVDSQIKTNQINPVGAGPIFIDGETLQLFSPGNDVHCNVGWVGGSPPTDEAILHVEGRGDSGILADGGDDGTGSSYLELRGETRSIALAVDVDATTDDAIFEASSQTSKAQNDIIFKVGGQYASDPGLDNRVAPTGGVEALKIYGADQNVEIANKLFFPDNKVQIGDADTEAARIQDMAIGKNAKSFTTGSGTGNNIAIGTNSKCGDTGAPVSNAFCFGTLATSTVNTSYAIGYNAQNSGAQGGCIGSGSNNSGSSGLAHGRNSVNSGVGGIAFGQSADCSSDGGVAFGLRANASGSSNCWAIGVDVNNTVSDSALLFDNTMTIGVGFSLFKGATNDVWTNVNAPLVSSAGLHTQNAASYTMTAEETINGFLRNTYSSGASTVTWPSRSTLTSFLENTVSGTPAGGSDTRHSSWKTTFINSSAQTITLTAGTNQTALGTSLSAGIGANECVTFESYLTGSSYITVRTSTQAI